MDAQRALLIHRFAAEVDRWTPAGLPEQLQGRHPSIGATENGVFTLAREL